VAPPALDAVVIEETGFHRGMGRQGFKASGGWISMSPDTPCVLRSDVIEGHHFWRLSARFNFPHVCSDALWQRIKAAGLRGWSADRKCQVKSI
jgi:hypothetical protein